MKNIYDFVIIGAGAVGLFLAHQLKDRYEDASILIIEKESAVAKHTSGRNSGVLHAGIYYEPNSVKGRVCKNGAIRLKEWIQKKSLPLNNCGKIIVAQDQSLDSQIDVLLERSKKNGVPVELLDMQQIKDIFPGARSATGRGIWSPNTSVTDPKMVMKELEIDLKSKGIEIIYDSFFDNIDTRSKSLRTNKSQLISYGHLFNCAGSYSVEIAKTVGIGMEYNVIPFKEYIGN